MGILFTILMGIWFTITIGILFTIVLGIQFTISIRSNYLLDVFGERFKVPSDLEYEYVWATINADREKLDVYHYHKLIVQYDYPLLKSSILLPKID